MQTAARTLARARTPATAGMLAIAECKQQQELRQKQGPQKQQKRHQQQIASYKKTTIAITMLLVKRQERWRK
jgi:hypothetical protein